MTVTTSRGKTFEIDWMWGPVGANGDLMLEYADARAMSRIARDFEGCEAFHRKSETEGDMDFDGYGRIVSIVRVNSGTQDTVRIALERPKEG